MKNQIRNRCYRNFLIVVNSTFILILSACTSSNFTGDSQFTLVNIKNFDRAQLGFLVNKVRQHDPKIVVLDFRLPELNDPIMDSIFQKAVTENNTKFVFTTSIKEIYSTKGLEEFTGDEKRATNLYFKTADYVEGHTDTFFKNIEDKPVMTTYPLSVILDNEVSQHASVLTAFFIDSLKTKKYIDTHNNYQDELNLLQERINQYQIVDIPFEDIDTYAWQKLTDKIVIMGYIGPTFEDKKYTLLNKNSFQEPDTHGPFLVAEIIANILNTH